MKYFLMIGLLAIVVIPEVHSEEGESWDNNEKIENLISIEGTYCRINYTCRPKWRCQRPTSDGDWQCEPVPDYCESAVLCE